MQKRARTDSSKEHRKQFILDCAEQLILEEGLPNFNLNKVSRKTKLAVGTIYLYFTSKEDIIAHLTIKSRQILLEKFQESTSKVENPLEKIEELLKSFYFFYKEKPYYNQLVSFYETNAGLEETEELKASSFLINTFVIDIVREGKKQNIVRNDLDEIGFSFLLWGTAIGIIQLIEVKSSSLENTLHVSQFDFYLSYISLITKSLLR